MYVEILSAALTASDGDHDVAVLIDRASEERQKMLGVRQSSLKLVSEAIAADVAYDRELVRLSAKLGTETEPARFASPATERERLERELALRGIHLEVAAEDSRSDHPLDLWRSENPPIVDLVSARQIGGNLSMGPLPQTEWTLDPTARAGLPEY